MNPTTKKRESAKRLPKEAVVRLAILALMFLAILALPLVSAKTALADNKASPSFAYWHVWTDAQGVSHQKKCEIHNFVLESIEPPAAPQWLSQLKTEGASVVISVLPVGWSVSGMKIPNHNGSFQFPGAGMFKPWMANA
jgi:hypothetical protein